MKKAVALLITASVAVLLCGCSRAEIAPLGLIHGDFGFASIPTRLDECLECDDEKDQAINTELSGEKLSSVDECDDLNFAGKATRRSPDELGVDKADLSVPSTPSAPAHQHSWTYHEAVTEQVWVPNQVYVPRYTCGTCGFNGFDIPTMNAHQEASGRGGCGAYYTSGYYEDQGYYETRTVSNAYYSCSCGATK